GEVRLNPGEGEVRALAVARAARGRGIGRALLEAVMRRAATRPGRGVLLLTPPGMRAAPHPDAGARVRPLPRPDHWCPPRPPPPPACPRAPGPWPAAAGPPPRAGSRSALLRGPVLGVVPFRLVLRRLVLSRLLGILAPPGLAGHLLELLVHRPQQEEQGQAHPGHHEEPENAGHHLAGRWRGQDDHRLTCPRMPAKRSSSGSSVSTSDRARW